MQIPFVVPHKGAFFNHEKVFYHITSPFILPGQHLLSGAELQAGQHYRETVMHSDAAVPRGGRECCDGK